MNWKFVSYSVSTGVVVTALSHLLYKQGGELVLWPGIFIELMVNILLLFVSESDNFYSLPSRTDSLINSVFYSAVIFVILSATTRLGWLRQRQPISWSLVGLMRRGLSGRGEAPVTSRDFVPVRNTLLQ